MRSLKLLAILFATIIVFLALLHFNVSFGIALLLSMGIMVAGVKYLRKDDPDPEAPSDDQPEDK